ncbi:MAG: IS110 family transposase, partial [Chloroflexota bacterium]|nr:IS110 family transposase [Chloroflexota bacterium]
ATNDADGLTALVSRLHELQPTLVVLEASGGYERPLTAMLAGADLPAAVINPRQARNFAKATGKLSKTDALDARALAHFSEAVQPPARPVPGGEAQALAGVLTRRRQLVEMLTAERNRLHTAAAAVRERIAARIAWLEEELDATNQELARAIGEDPAWRERDALLRGVPGGGPGLSTTLLAELPELGALTRQQVATLTGVASLNRDSGTRRGQRAARGGRAQLRAALYMGTLAATRFTPAIKAFYDRPARRASPRRSR